MNSLVVSRMCPDQGSNVQPRHIGTMLKPAKLVSQGKNLFSKYKEASQG